MQQYPSDRTAVDILRLRGQTLEGIGIGRTGLIRAITMKPASISACQLSRKAKVWASPVLPSAACRLKTWK